MVTIVSQFPFNAITGQSLQDVRGMAEAIGRGEVALASLRYDRFVVDQVIVVVNCHYYYCYFYLYVSF